MNNLLSLSALLPMLLVTHLGVASGADEPAQPPIPVADSRDTEDSFGERLSARGTSESPNATVVLEALNRELQNPSLHLSGCRISHITFKADGEVTSTVVAGTIAFSFQEPAVIAAAQRVLSDLGFDRWLQVSPVNAGLDLEPPDARPLLQQLKAALRENETTCLRAIITDAQLDPDPNASGQSVLTLSGVVSAKDVEEAVVSVANEVATEFFAPYIDQTEELNHINVLPTNVNLVQDARAQAFEFGRLARHFLRRGRAPEAVRLLEFAALADNRTMETMYWLAIAHLEAGQEHSARIVLETTISQNASALEAFHHGANNEYIDIYRSLCEVQGTARRRLHELEREIYLDFRMMSQPSR